MTVLQYLRQSGVATTAEIMALAKEHPADFERLKQMAREQAEHQGIKLEVTK